MKKLLFVFIALCCLFISPASAEQSHQDLIGPIEPRDGAFQMYIFRDGQRGVDCYFREGTYATTMVCMRRVVAPRDLRHPTIIGPVQRGSGLNAVKVYTLLDPMWRNACYITYAQRGVHTPSCVNLPNMR